MTGSQSALKKKFVTVRMTHAMYANLKRLAGHERKVGGLIREAIRHYIGDRGEITGSGRGGACKKSDSNSSDNSPQTHHRFPSPAAHRAL